MLFKFKDAQNHMQRLGKAAKDRKYGSAVPTGKGLLVPEYPPVALAIRNKNGRRALKKKKVERPGLEIT